MPINIISWDGEHVLGEYIDKNKVVHSIPELLGAFDGEEEAKLALLDECSRINLISNAQWMAMRRHIINPPSKKHFSKMGKKSKR